MHNNCNKAIIFIICHLHYSTDFIMTPECIDLYIYYIVIIDALIFLVKLCASLTSCAFLHYEYGFAHSLSKKKGQKSFSAFMQSSVFYRCSAVKVSKERLQLNVSHCFTCIRPLLGQKMVKDV